MAFELFFEDLLKTKLRLCLRGDLSEEHPLANCRALPLPLMPFFPSTWEHRVLPLGSSAHLILDFPPQRFGGNELCHEYVQSGHS